MLYPKLRRFLLALLLAALLMAGCQSGTGPSQGVGRARPSPTPLAGTDRKSTPTPARTPTPTLQPTSALGIEAGDLAGVELKFWHSWSGAAGEAVQALTETFNRANEWGIQVESVYQGNYDALDAQIRRAFEAPPLPDVALGYRYQMLNWPDAPDHLVELNQYIDDPIWGWTADDQDDFYAAFWNFDADGKRRLGIPAQRSAALLFYNRTWAEELGFNQPPVTPTEFKRQACAAARANRADEDQENDGSGGWIISTDYAIFLGWMNAFNDGALPRGNRGYDFATPEVERAFHFLRELYDLGCAWLPENQAPETAFIQRRGLFSSGTVASIPYQERLFADAGSQDVWVVLPFPAEGGDGTLPVYGPSFALLRSNPNQQLAGWLFIKWLVEAQNQAQLAEASAYLPVRISSRDHLQRILATYPQWEATLDMLDGAVAEPSFASWNTVRWAVSDAATQLFRYYFTIEQVPQLVELLDDTAHDLHTGNQ